MSQPMNTSTYATDAAFWRDRPTLVTGATGLVGSWTVRQLLDARAHVVCLVRDQVAGSELVRSGLIQRCDVVRGELEDPALLERTLGEYEIKTVLHLAAQTIVKVANQNPVPTFRANIEGTWNLLDACRRINTAKHSGGAIESIVMASSDKAYGEQKVQPYTEDMPLQGRHPYDASKSCADLIAQTYAHTYGLPVVITRCGNFYGGGDLNWNRIVPGTVRSLFRGQRPVIRSDGSMVRDYFYVEDGARVYLLLGRKLAEDKSLVGRALNFSNESQVTVLELVEKIAAAMGSDLTPDVRNEATHEIPHQCLDATRARTELGWTPAFTLESALDRTIDWYRAFLSEGADAR
jgi:CDP-glucose 4,6-dehydratase